MATMTRTPERVAGGHGGRPSIVVLGGGFGGLETAFYLRWKLGDRARITLVSDQLRFLFKPNSIYIPFGLDPESLYLDLEPPLRRRGIEFQHTHVEGVDSAMGTVETALGRIAYDHLVIATGASMRPQEVPGLGEYANTIFTPDAMLELRASLNQVVEETRAGARKRVLFLAPPNNKCVGPLYEMVMMTDTWLRRQGVRSSVELTWTTFERHYIQVFGPRVHDAMQAEFEHRGIPAHLEYSVAQVGPESVAYANGEKLPYDLLVSFPPYAAGTQYGSLPHDDRGFISTEFDTRQVKEHPEIFAVGDSADFPVKQAFLALLQADTAAQVLSARILHEPEAPAFDPTSLCVMEQFDHATFAQVPMRLTGRPELPVEVRPEDEARYKVGVSPAWRLGKKAIGLTIPWRFGQGLPYHAGLPWQVMDAGLGMMSAVLAR